LRSEFSDLSLSEGNEVRGTMGNRRRHAWAEIRERGTGRRQREGRQKPRYTSLH